MITKDDLILYLDGEIANWETARRTSAYLEHDLKPYVDAFHRGECDDTTMRMLRVSNDEKANMRQASRQIDHLKMIKTLMEN